MRGIANFGKHLGWALVALAAKLIILWFLLNLISDQAGSAGGCYLPRCAGLVGSWGRDGCGPVHPRRQVPGPHCRRRHPRWY